MSEVNGFPSWFKIVGSVLGGVVLTAIGTAYTMGQNNVSKSYVNDQIANEVSKVRQQMTQDEKQIDVNTANADAAKESCRKLEIEIIRVEDKIGLPERQSDPPPKKPHSR